MKSSTKVLRIAIPAVLGIGIATAVVSGRGRVKREATIPAGTTLVAALEHQVSTERNRSGDGIELHTVEPLRLSENVELPAGIVIRGSVIEAKGGGRIAGTPELALRFTELEIDGETHAISTSAFRVKGKNDAGQSALQIGGGAVAGGIVGRVLGGKGGTLKGAVAGAAIGTGVAVATKGDQLYLPAGQRLKVRLSGPVTVRYRPGEQARESTR
ncbi:MAG: hypothetical protein ACREMF_05655 [Gemmatimonadales bacterium]